jgi:23S rRNA pseudouridine1911/1915/1917 synthase
MVVHPAPGHPVGTLADGLRQRGTTWSQLGGRQRAGIVHRLDRDTSGLLVVAKTEAAHRSLSLQLQRRTLGRVYWALVHGTFREATGRIEAPIGRDPGHRQRMAVVDEGRPAITDFTVVERMRRFSRLEVRLLSGRTHQIRVHLASIGHPISGDPVYGRRGDSASPRPALHAQRLSFVHPVGGERCDFEAPLPDDLIAALAAAALS